MGIFGFGAGGRRGGGSGSIFSEFEEMRREMERIMEETIQDTNRLPKDLIREYETPEGGKVKEVGPIVYGYSMTVGPDGKPKVREFGNVRPMDRGSIASGGVAAPQLTAEREPMADIVTSDKEVKAIVEMPGISKQDITVSTYDNSVEVSTTDKAARKYRKVIELPPEADIETAKSTYNNGILEIIFSKKVPPKAKGKQIKVE
jgi:HSP20 family protein